MDENITNIQEVEQVEEVEQFHITKNLANCTGVEFLRQSNRIRKNVEVWLKDTDVLKIRKNRAKLTPITNEMSKEEKEAIQAENEARRKEQVRKNISDMLDVCLETHAEETFKVLCLMCFVDPADSDKVKVPELLGNFSEMLGDDGVISFFVSLTKWEAMLTSK